MEDQDEDIVSGAEMWWRAADHEVSAASNADRKKPGRAGKGVRRESLERIGKIVGEDEWLEGEVVRVEDYGIFVNIVVSFTRGVGSTFSKRN